MAMPIRPMSRVPNWLTALAAVAILSAMPISPSLWPPLLSKVAKSPPLCRCVLMSIIVSTASKLLLPNKVLRIYAACRRYNVPWRLSITAPIRCIATICITTGTGQRGAFTSRLAGHFGYIKTYLNMVPCSRLNRHHDPNGYSP